MKTLSPPTISQDLNSSYIFLDTGVFIFAAKNKSFFEFLVSLKNDANCSFATIPSVLFEFTNGSSSLDVYNERQQFISKIAVTIDPMKFINNIPDFSVVMSKVNESNKSYTDFLLSACVFNYNKTTKVKLMTLDLKALPSFFPREHIIAVEHNKEVRIFGVYGFDNNGYAKAAKSVLES